MKKWYASKTLWVNIIALAALLAQLISGKTIISIEAQAMLLSVVNLILRLITKDKIGIVDDTQV